MLTPLASPTVVLQPDHPGFKDPVYRARRDKIAALALAHEAGTPCPIVPYTPEEHEVWRTIQRALAPRHARYAVAEFHACADRLRLSPDEIPQLDDVCTRVEAISGFRLEPVAGLVEPRVFLASLADRIFLSTQYIRHHSAPMYTPEPDIVHELVGHAIMLASPRIASLSRLVGEAVARTRSPEGLARLAQLHWYTLEFGVAREDGEVKAYGAGLLSSAGELESIAKAELRPVTAETLDEVSRTPYNPTTFQPHLFCAPSFDQLVDDLTAYLEAWPGG